MKQFTKRNAALLVVIGLHLCVSFVVPMLLPEWMEQVPLLGAVLAGLLASQPVLLSAWAMLAVAPKRVRWPASLAAGMVSLYLLAFSAKIATPWVFNDALHFLAASVLLTLFLFLYLFIEMIGKRNLWCIGSSQSGAEGELRGDQQFSLRDLMLWTAGVALVFGLGRLLLSPTVEPGDLGMLDRPYLGVPVWLPMLVVLMLPGAFAAGVVLHSERWPAWLTAACGSALIATTVVFALLAVVLQASASYSDFIRITRFCFVLEIGLCGGVVGTLAILAAGGWRMDRGGGRAGPPAGDDGVDVGSERVV